MHKVYHKVKMWSFSTFLIPENFKGEGHLSLVRLWLNIYKTIVKEHNVVNWAEENGIEEWRDC